MKTNVHLWLYLAEFFVEWEIFQTEIVGEDQNTHFVFGNFFRESCRLWDNVEKMLQSPAGPRWQYNRVRAHCMLDN
jgi:hypothetical protein